MLGPIAYLIIHKQRNTLTPEMDEKLKNAILSHYPQYSSIQHMGECECWICHDMRQNGGDLRDHLWKNHKNEFI